MTPGGLRRRVLLGALAMACASVACSGKPEGPNYPSYGLEYELVRIVPSAWPSFGQGGMALCAVTVGQRLRCTSRMYADDRVQAYVHDHSELAGPGLAELQGRVLDVLPATMRTSLDEQDRLWDPDDAFEGLLVLRDDGAVFRVEMDWRFDGYRYSDEVSLRVERVGARAVPLLDVTGAPVRARSFPPFAVIGRGLAGLAGLRCLIRDQEPARVWCLGNLPIAKDDAYWDFGVTSAAGLPTDVVVELPWTEDVQAFDQWCVLTHGEELRCLDLTPPSDDAGMPDPPTWPTRSWSVPGARQVMLVGANVCAVFSDGTAGCFEGNWRDRNWTPQNLLRLDLPAPVRLPSQQRFTRCLLAGPSPDLYCPVSSDFPPEYAIKEPFRGLREAAVFGFSNVCGVQLDGQVQCAICNDRGCLPMSRWLD